MQAWRAQCESSFFSVTTAVEFLLEETSEDDMMQVSLLDIDWTRFACAGEDREHWVSIATKWRGYAVDVMIRQAKDDWILR